MFHHDVDNFEDVSTSLQSLQNDVDDLNRQAESHHADLNERIESAENENSQLQRRLDKIDGQMQQLADQIAILERRALTTASERADFDTRTPTERRLATSARRGKELETQLMPEATRQVKRESIARFDKAVQTLTDSEESLVAAAKALANLEQRDPRTTEHQDTKALFEQCKSDVLTKRRLAPAHRRHDVDKDRAALASDAKMRAKHGAEIDTGQQDWLQLRKTLRNRVSKAIDSGAALPPWFTTALGPTPPATRTEQWLNTATLLLAYRALYGITDLVIALGPKPPQDSGLRYQLYQKLKDQLKQHQRR